MNTIKNISMVGIVVGLALVAVMLVEAIKTQHANRACEYGMCEVAR